MNSQIQALADYTFTAKYAKYLKDKKRRETWDECTNRSYDMHKIKYSGVWNKIESYVNDAFEDYRNKFCLGSQRNLQFAGDAIFKKNARSYNCCGSYCDRPRFFQEAMYLLLCGCGVGFSVQKHHIEKLPELNLEDKKETCVFQIPDSIEGWSDAIGILVASYFKNSDLFSEYANKLVRFDYSLIRPEGSEFSHGIGKAPGPEPLRRSLEKIRNILDTCVRNKQTKLKPINAYDIVMHSSDAVLAGGIRRSATICIFSVDDVEMMEAKTGNWYSENPQRARSNNSALLLRNSTTKEQFNKLITCTRKFGEPGFLWTDNLEFIYNPCFTEDTWIFTQEGPKQIKELIGKPFKAYVNGKLYNSTDKGFFETGIKQVYEIMTKEGFKVKATENHKFLVNTYNGDKIWKELKDLKINDQIIIHNHETPSWKGTGGTFKEGWMLGSMIGDGYINDDYAALCYWGESRKEMLACAVDCLESSNLKTYHNFKGSDIKSSEYGRVNVTSKKLMDLAHTYNVKHNHKIITEEIEKGSSEFYKGIIRGYFDADGTVQLNIKKNCRSIRLSSVTLGNLEAIQRMLLRLGIYSRIYKNRQKEGYRIIRGESWWCQTGNELHISRDMIIKFQDLIGFSDPDKKEKLKECVDSLVKTPYGTKWIGTVSSISSKEIEKVYDCTIDTVHAFDANGFYAHNCVEINFYCYDEFGNSGWEFCNLSTINTAKIKTKSEFFRVARSAAILGTLQAGYTDFEYLGEVTERICRKESLLGVSMTGILQGQKFILNPETQKEAAELIVKTNKELALLLGINQAARTTCIKPEGSASCMLGTTSGIHPEHAPKYIRRVQANKNESPVNFYRELNPIAIEESSWSANNSDYCIAFACEAPVLSIYKKDLSAIEHLEIVKSTQNNWVKYGKTESLCAKPELMHNVSNTIIVKDNEWDIVEEYIFNNKDSFSGISLISDSGDKDYVQAPFTEVKEPEEIVKEYGQGSLFASGLIDEAMKVYGDLWKACDQVMGFGEDLNERKILDHQEYKRKEKIAFIERVKKFSKKYLSNDLKKTTYLLKDVYNWKLWMDINREHRKVHFEDMIEENNTTKGAQEVACAGGQCSL